MNIEVKDREELEKFVNSYALVTQVGDNNYTASLMGIDLYTMGETNQIAKDKLTDGLYEWIIKGKSPAQIKEQ